MSIYKGHVSSVEIRLHFLANSFKAAFSTRICFQVSGVKGIIVKKELTKEHSDSG